jgi:hypothetical protein
MQESSSAEMRELAPSELASVAGGVAFAAGGTNSAAVTLAGGNGTTVTTFFAGDGTSATATINGGGFLWDARAT